MKYKSKFLIFLVAVLAASLMTLLSACVPTETDDVTDYVYQLEFNLINNGTEYAVSKGSLQEIRVKKNSPFNNVIEIPSEYNGKPVTEVSADGFKEIEIYIDPAYKIEESVWDYMYPYYITVPEGVTKIGEQAFYNSMVVLTLPDTVTSIGKNAYNWSIYDGLDWSGYGIWWNICRDILFENGIIDEYNVIYSGKYVMGKLYNNQINQSDTIIRDGTILIADGAFEQTGTRNALVLPEGLKWIGKGALHNCGYGKINLPDSLEYIDLDIFYGIGVGTERELVASNEMFYRYLDMVTEKYLGQTGLFTIVWVEGATSWVDDYRDYILYIGTGDRGLDSRRIATFNSILHEFRHYYQFIAVNGFSEIYGVEGLGYDDLLIKPTEEKVVEWYETLWQGMINDNWPSYYGSPVEDDARAFAALYC